MLLPALGALALVVAAMVLLIVVESIRFAEARERIRHEDDQEGAGGAEHP
jgi:hypothetical protein